MLNSNKPKNSPKKVVHFTPEFVVHYIPDCVVHFAPEYSQTAYALSNIQKMSFKTGNLIVTKADNISKAYDPADLRCLNFSDISIGFGKSLFTKNQMIHAYPVPVSNVLYIDLSGLDEKEGMITILSLEGKAVMSRRVVNASLLSLNISHLLNGIYICRYSNDADIKTVKIIKQ